MTTALLICLGIMIIFITALLIKIHLLKKAAKEIAADLAEKLSSDTNTLVTISSHDRAMQKLATQINEELLTLRTKRHLFEQGDRELKNAVTNISHDLRTPLTSIRGYLDLLAQEEKSPEVARYLSIIQDRTDALCQLTEELFRYSVVLSSDKKLKKEPVILNRLLEESIAAFYALLSERGITPLIQMPDESVSRMLDASALSRVFTNLLQNVIKYSDGDLQITLFENGEILFVNTASALNEIEVGKLFDRFYTVENARKSTGLGLSIAKTLVLEMNGTISAFYEKNKLYIRLFFPD